MITDKPSTVVIVSDSPNSRVAISRDLTRREWAPVPVSTWQRACEHGLENAHAVVTDAAGLAAAGADLAILGVLPGWVPVLVIRTKGLLPRWARHRVQELPRADIPSYLDRYERERVKRLGALDKVAAPRNGEQRSQRAQV